MKLMMLEKCLVVYCKKVAKEFVNRSIGIECETSMESMWTVHSYNGDYNPVHDHALEHQWVYL